MLFEWVFAEGEGGVSLDVDGWGDRGLPPTLRNPLDRARESAATVGDVGEDRDL